MKDENIPSVLQERVVKFYQYLFARTQGLDYNLLFSDTPSWLKTEIFIRLGGNLLKRQRLFNNLSESFLRQLSAKLKLRIYTNNEYIIKKGDVVSEMFLISRGKVRVIDYKEQNKKNMKILTTGHVYGHVFLIKRMRAQESLYTENYVDVLILMKADLEEVVAFYPEIRRKIQRRMHDLYGQVTVDNNE
ncbi:cyclic nucleotide-gated cation channel alpha-3-like [Latimeria chalumnae]|uniref:cyclic nucleotide-gated cation channel alpha-3-like n=1 Tax=Latimeria chalumnae TaxID=7897 RepID=UPI0003C1A444